MVERTTPCIQELLNRSSSVRYQDWRHASEELTYGQQDEYKAQLR
jgi:hypothetical protein